MKLFAKKTAVRHEPESVLCNICGKAVEKNEMGYMMDYVTITKTWGFHSPYDGEMHEFDICIECYKTLLGAFKIAPVRTEPDEILLA